MAVRLAYLPVKGDRNMRNAILIAMLYAVGRVMLTMLRNIAGGR